MTHVKAIAVALALGLAVPAAALAGGIDTFKAKGCSGCHAISSQGITGADMGPDLAGVGNRQDAEFLKKFLRQKAPKDGKMHMMKFAGTKEEFFELIDWLMTLK